MDSTRQILYRIRHHVDLTGTPLTKLGEVLGSEAKDRQAKINAAKLFLEGNPRSFTMERVERVSRHFGRDFLKDTTPPTAAAPRAPYGWAAKVESASDRQLDRYLTRIVDKDPDLLAGVPLSSLSPDAKRVILRAYTRHAS